MQKCTTMVYVIRSIRSIYVNSINWAGGQYKHGRANARQSHKIKSQMYCIYSRKVEQNLYQGRYIKFQHQSPIGKIWECSLIFFFFNSILLGHFAFQTFIVQLSSSQFTPFSWESLVQASISHLLPLQPAPKLQGSCPTSYNCWRHQSAM